MKAGDILLLLVIVGSIAGIILDQTMDGALSTALIAMARLLGRYPDLWLGVVMLQVLPLLYGAYRVVWGRNQDSPLPNSFAVLLKKQIQVTDWVSTTLADAVRWLALALVLVTVTVVIQRYVFGASSTKLQESVIYFHSLLFLFSAGAALLSDAHVRVDIVYSKLSPKGKAWTDFLGYILALMPMSVIILLHSQSYVGSAWRSLEGSRESDGLPLIFLLKTSIPVFALLIAFQGAAMSARALLTLANREPPPLPKSAEKEL